ncbi:MAG TPA: hypothetical protein VGE74_30445 [Gemmata sp.]
MAKAKKAPAKATPKKRAVSAEKQQALDEMRKEQEEAEAFEAHKQKAEEDEAERRRPFAANEDKIQKALDNCEGHLRKLGNLDLAREVLRRLTDQVRRGLPQTLKKK